MLCANIQYVPRMPAVKLARPSIEQYDKRGVSALCRSFEINSREEPLRRCLPLPRLPRSLL